jgi:transposase
VLAGRDRELAPGPRVERPAEAINNLVKRVKRAAFGFRKFRHYRIRSLLYAGRPDWTLLATVTPR